MSQLLQTLKIGPRLGVAFAVLILLLVALCGVGALSARSLAKDLDTTARVDITLVRAANALQERTHLVARSSRELLIVDSGGQIKRLKAAIEESLTDGETQLAEVQKLAGQGENGRLIEDVKTQKAAYTSAVRKFLTVYDAGNPDDSRSALLIELRPVQQAYEKSVEALGLALKEQVESRAAAGGAAAQRSVWLMLVFGAVGLVLAVSAAWVISRSITVPLQHAMDAAERIKSGDLSRRIDSGARDEIGALLRAMGGMQQHLLGVIEDVQRCARDLAAHSDELAGGNTELSTRTERNAASLQQTASAVEQIAATVQGNSQKTREASQVATSARDAVVEGGKSVEQLVETMTRISGSSTRIKDIIAVIDGIAFQTNILALNAAVEAARAGEHGRGFAVVATEVRSLAGRASSAAREIKSLIDDSAERVADGTRTVAEVGERIGGIVKAVMDVRQLVEEVSHASHEQVTGMASINGSVGEVDQATQQNAALVEEIAATTESLKSNAERLVKAVAFFRLPGGAAA